MPRKRKARKFLVSTADIRSDIKEAARRLKALKRKPAFRSKRKTIDLELRILKACFDKLGNVRWI